MKSKLFFSMTAILLLLGVSLFAQPPCTEYPSPVIQPDFMSLCQDPPRETHGEPFFNPDPVPQEEVCQVVCENNPVTYINPNAGAGNTIYWEAFGDVTPTTGTGNSFTVNWGSPGTGMIQVTETTPDGCATTVNVCVEIVESPTADFTSLPPESGGVINICDGGEVFFQDQSSDDVITWVWDFGDTNQSNDPSPSHIYSGPGSYTVTLTVYNDCGCSDTRDVLVIVDPAQAPIISCVSTVCEGDKEKYTVTNGCAGATYLWTVVGGTVSSTMDNMVWIDWSSPVNGQGILTVEILGCPNICTIPTSVIVPILTSNLTMSGPDVVCVGDLVEYTIPPQPGSLYSWYGSAASFFTSNPNDHSIDVQWDVPGTYTICVQLSQVSVVATDTNPGCDIPYTPYCKTVLVKQPFVVSPEFAEICETGSATFCTNPSPSGVTWMATNADGTVTAALPAGFCTTVSGLAPGFYEIIATTSDNTYCNGTASGFLTVKPSAPSLTPAALTGTDPICPGSTYNYSATPDNGYYLTWVANGGTVIGTGNDVAIEWNGSAPYSIDITQNPMTGPSCPSVTNFPISVIMPVTPTIGGATTVCTDAEVTYSAGPLPNVTFIQWEIDPSDIDMGSIVSGANNANATIQFNNTTGPMLLHFNYTVCNVVYTESITINITGFPAVNLSVPIDACQNDLVNMSATLSPAPGGTVTWAWDFGDTGTGSGASTSHTYASQGTFAVSATATYSGGTCNGTSTASQLIDIKPSPLINITTTDGNILCPPLTPSTTLVASVTGGTGTYTYDWSGPISGTGSTLWVNVQGNYTLLVTDVTNGCTSTEVFRVRMCSGPPPPPCTGVDFNASPNCNTYNFNAILSGGYTSPTWVFGDDVNNTASGYTPSHTYDESGYYFVTLTATNGSSCSITKRVTVPFVPNFIAEFSCPSNQIAVTLLDQTDYIQGLINPALFTYNWSYPLIGGGTGTSTSANPVLTNMGSGLVTMAVSYNGGTPCIITTPVNIPTPITAGFTANDPACEGNPIDFTNASTPFVSDIASATWTFGDGAGSNLVDAERTYTYADSGPNPLVTLTVTDVWGCTDSYSDNVSVNQNTLIGNVTITAPAAPVCPSPPVTLSANVGGGTSPYTFLWDLNDLPPPPTGAYGTGMTSNTIGATGEYVVVVTDAFGCQERSPLAAVTIIPAPVAFIIGQDEYCIGDQLELSANQGTGYSYTWNYNTPSGGPFTFPGPNISLPLLQAGTYTFTVMLTDNLTNCTNTSSVFTVIVHDEPQGLTIASSGNCVPANLTASVTGPAGVDYVWSNGDVGANATILGGGTVEVTAYTPEGCSTSETIDIGEGPDLSDVAIGCYCFPDHVVWTAPQGAGYSYQWFMNGSPIGSNSYQYTITTSGVYNVIVTSANGCSSESGDINVDIGGECSDCKFIVKLLKLDCIGKDSAGNSIYSFTTSVTNYGINLSGFTGTSGQGVVSGLSPSNIPGGGATTIVTGTFTLFNPNTSAVINFQGAGVGGLACDFDLEITKFPPCGSDCEVIWHQPTVECLYTQNGYTYYNFTVAASNLGNPLFNLQWYPCSSPDVEVISSSPNNLPANVSTIINGVLKVRNGITSDCFRICGYDPITRKECCQEIVMEFPPCEERLCDVIWHEPNIECFNTTGGYTYYTYDIAASNLGAALTNITWYPCSSPDVAISTSTYGLPSQVSTIFEGMIRVRNGITSDCFRVCGFDPITGEECCFEIEMQFPECSDSQKPCSAVTDMDSYLTCASPSTDPNGNPIYNFNITVSSHVSNGPGYLLPWYNGHASNNVIVTGTNVTGNVFNYTGTVVDMPGLNGQICFQVITFDGQEICWTRICLQLPDCSDTDAEDKVEVILETPKSELELTKLSVVPNPASDFINVSFDLATAGAIEMKMIRMDGQLVRHHTALSVNTSLPVDVSDLPGGLYLVAIFKDGQMVAQEKVAILNGY